MTDIYEDIFDLVDEARQEAFDDGYSDGVRDARLNPKEADRYIKLLMDLYAEEDLWDNSPSEYAPPYDDFYDERDEQPTAADIIHY
jgi:hypothetical protein